MAYFRCPTCKELLANKRIVFDIEMKKINNKPANTKEQIEKRKQEIKKLLDDIGGDNPLKYCCRMRLSRTLDLISIVK